MNSQFKCPSCRIVTGSNSTDFTVHTDDDRIEQNATSFKLFLFTRNEYLKALVEHDQKVAQAQKDVDKLRKVVEELYTIAKNSNADIARLGEERIIVTPPGVKIWKPDYDLK